jgi:hypothetical protein
MDGLTAAAAARQRHRLASSDKSGGSMIPGFYLDLDDQIINPAGKPIGKLYDLSWGDREEFREHLEDGIRKAVARARYDWEHEHEDAENFGWE